MATKMESGHRLAERRVGRLQNMVHLGSEPRRYIPVVGLGEHMIAALEPNPPIAERLVWLDVERGAHVGGRRLDRIAHPLGDDARRIGQSMVGAPAFEGECRAVMGEETG